MIEDCQKQYDDFHKDKETRVRQQAELKRKKDELIQMQKVVLDQDPALIALGDSIREAETDLKRLQNNKQRFVEQINAFAKEIPLLKFWEEGFGTKGIRNMLLDDIRIMMAYYIKVYSEKLIGINTRIEIPIDSNKFDILVSYKGKTRDIATYSRGEVWRCCLVVLLTIRKILSVLNTFPFDIIFLDDCLGDIDETGVELIAETVMEELPKEFRYVFATIPRHIEKIPEDNIVIVNKRYGNSYI
jgi:DNA repair exonuclease SbcCD ATPase subunit